MTQLLLFDAPAHSSFPLATESPARPSGRPERETKQRRRLGSSQGNLESPSERARDQKASAEEATPPRGGVHRMGDLANLVIARYELVAKRRAALLARGPLPSVRY